MSGEQVSLVSHEFMTPTELSNHVLIFHAFVYITMEEALESIHTGPSIGVMAVIGLLFCCSSQLDVIQIHSECVVLTS